MRHYQTVFSVITLGIMLSGCNGGSTVAESDQLANNPAQETAVSNGSETVTQTPTENNTTSGSEQTTVITTPPVSTTTTTPVRPVSTSPSPSPSDTSSSGSTDSVSEAPWMVEEEPVSETPAPVVEPVVGAANLAAASISGEDVVLNWEQANDDPEGGYNIVIDGVNTGSANRTLGTSATITGLDLTAQHCFVVQARYTQLSPEQYLDSNSLCTDAQQAANQAPVITGTPEVSVDVGGTYSFTPGAFDDDNDDLTFSVTNQPSWAQFNTQTGRLSGTPAAGDVGDYNNIVISVTDGTDDVSLTAFTISVNSVAVASVPETGSIALSWTAPTTRTDGTPLSLSEIKGYCIYVGTTRDNLQMRVDLNEGYRTNYVLNDLEVGEYYVAISVYDQQEYMSDYSNIVLKTAVN